MNNCCAMRAIAAGRQSEVKIIRIESFADPFVDQRHRYGELGYKIDAHFVRTEPGYEIAVQVQDESLPCNVTGVAVPGCDHLRLDREF